MTCVFSFFRIRCHNVKVVIARPSSSDFERLQDELNDESRDAHVPAFCGCPSEREGFTAARLLGGSKFLTNDVTYHGNYLDVGAAVQDSGQNRC